MRKSKYQPEVAYTAWLVKRAERAVGAALFEYSYSSQPGVATRAGWGAVVGRAAAAAMKIAFGLVIAAIGAFAALS